MTKVRILKGIFAGQDLEFVGYTNEIGGSIQTNTRDRLTVVKTPEKYKKRNLFYYLSNNVGPLQIDSWSNIPPSKYPFYMVSDKDGDEAGSCDTLEKAIEIAKNDIMATSLDLDADLYILVPIYKIERSISTKITKL